MTTPAQKSWERAMRRAPLKSKELGKRVLVFGVKSPMSGWIYVIGPARG